MRHLRALLLAGSVVLSPAGTFVCEVRARQCEHGPRNLVGLFEHSAFAQGYGGIADYFLGSLHVFRVGRHGDLEEIGRFDRCPRLARGLYRCAP